jgi:hypothetical protein
MLKREGTYVYTKERTRVPSLKQWVQYVLYTEKGADIMCYQITMRTCTEAI